MDAAAFCGSGVLAARVATFAEEMLDTAAALASLTDADFDEINPPLSGDEREAFQLRALLHSVRPELLASKGDLVEDNWGTLSELKSQAVQNWDNVRSRLRGDLGMTLGDVTMLRQRLSPASEMVAFPPVDIKLDGDDDDGREHKVPKPRRKKDRNAPKRPRNAYLVFLDRHRPAKHAANPQAAMKDLTCEMAKEWQLIAKDETNAEKKICDEIAKQNKADYEVAMRAYQELTVGGAGVPAASHAGDEGAGM